MAAHGRARAFANASATGRQCASSCAVWRFGLRVMPRAVCAQEYRIRLLAGFKRFFHEQVRRECAGKG